MVDHLINRRTALLGASAVAAAASSGASAQTGPRKTFLLIHGAYHGGWCWRPVTDILESQGHKAYAPSLTGNADRGHLLNMNVNLDVQATDIVNLVKWEDLKDFCLVVHSFGGWPASAAMEQIYDRVSSVVWVDGFMPKDGQKALDDISPFSRKALEDAMARGEAGRKPPPAKTYSITPSQYPWIESKLSPQPNGVAFQAIKLTGKLQQVSKKTFIRLPKYPQAALDRALSECRADKGWQTYVQTDSGHDVMIDKPKWLADLLLRAS